MVTTIFQRIEDDIVPSARAAAKGLMTIVKSLIRKVNHDIVLGKHEGRSLLSFAAEGGSSEVVRLCLEIDRRPRALLDHAGLTPLHWATIQNSAEAARPILEAGNLDANKPDSNGQTPLSLAVKSGRVDVVRVLVDSKGTNLEHKDSKGRTPQSLSAEAHTYIIYDYNHKVYLPPIVTWGKNAAATMKVLLDTTNVDPDSIDKQGWSPLCYALQGGNLEGVTLLVERGKVDVNLNTRPDGGLLGQTRPLIIAKNRMSLNVVKQIVTFLEFHGAYRFPPLQQPLTNQKTNKKRKKR